MRLWSREMHLLSIMRTLAQVLRACVNAGEVWWQPVMPALGRQKGGPVDWPEVVSSGSARNLVPINKVENDY